MLRTAAIIFGAVFLAIGILGFIPGLTPDNQLFGVFDVNTAHNIVHLATGVVALACGLTSWRASRLYFQVFGIVYGLVTVLGLFVGKGEILGFIANNGGDVVLHLIIAVVALYLGFGHVGSEEESQDTV